MWALLDFPLKWGTRHRNGGCGDASPRRHWIARLELKGCTVPELEQLDQRIKQFTFSDHTGAFRTYGQEHALCFVSVAETHLKLYTLRLDSSSAPGTSWTRGAAARPGAVARCERHAARLRAFTPVTGSGCAFAAAKADGSIVTWGVCAVRRNSRAVTAGLSGGVTSVVGNGTAFAAASC